MKRLRFHLFILLSLLMASWSAQALEVYSLLDKKCQLREGLILGVTPSKVEMLGLDGKYTTITKDDVRHLAIYNTVDNPIARFSDHQRLRRHLVEIYVNNSSRPSFIGWPVKFVENLVIFYDLKGKTHVFELFKIRKIRPYRGEKLAGKSLAHHRVSLSYSSWVSQCQLPGKSDKTKSAVRPTRMLGDQIQISEFLTRFEEGFEGVTSFQERTYVYARPFLYEKETKLGFLIADKYQLAPSAPMPMYFQWAKGREFRFQSFNQIGSVPVEYLPTAEPLFTFRSDLKSHIFHASFVGNLSALAAGTEYFTANQESLPIKPDKPSFKAHSAASVNYMALMGGDWGPWSFSIGTYFPVFMVQVRNEFREILASKLAPLFRVMYTGPNFRLRGVLGQTELKEDNGVKDTQVSRDTDLSVVGYLSSFSFDSRYLRAGIDYQLNKDLEFTLDQLWLQASYEEGLTSAARNQMDFSHLVTQASVRHYFGEYVSLRAYFNFFKVEEDYNFSGFNETDSSSEFTYGGTFEFIF